MSANKPNPAPGNSGNTDPGDKSALRREALRRRRGLDPAWREAASSRIIEHALALPEVRQASVVCLYASFGHEVATHELIGRLIGLKGGVALPRTLREENRLELRWCEAFPRDCVSGPFGILEPDPALCPRLVEVGEVDVFLVPGAIFSREGYRIGYGGGFYDRLLAGECHATAIGLAFSSQIVETLPADPWDRPVGMILTEEGLAGG